MTSSDVAWGKAHGALVRYFAAEPDPSGTATEVLQLLRRLGWRWVPVMADEPTTGEAAPPPAEWKQVRQQIRDRVHAAHEGEV